jgi:stage III sporulation protein SpoIIIAA
MKLVGTVDENAIFEAVYSGVKLLLTAHGKNISDVGKNMIDAKIFKIIVILKNENKPGELDKLYFLEGDKYVSYF